MSFKWLPLALASLPFLVACGASDNAGAADEDASISDGGTMDGATSADGTTGDGASSGDGALPSGPGLAVVGTHIVTSDGKPFHGRGANLHDTRSCNACSYMAADPAGVNRWVDELTDNWHANFIRLVLESSAAPADAFQMQWQNLSDDAVYQDAVKQIVAHITSKPGVYVMVTLFSDPTMKLNNPANLPAEFDQEWPTDATMPRYQLLAEMFHDNPQVLFALTNEPHITGSDADVLTHSAALAAEYQKAIDAIRAVETKYGSAKHVIVAQALLNWSRELGYLEDHPLTGGNIAYEVHIYDPQTSFDMLITQQAKKLPILIGEYGTSDGTNPMSTSDIQALWTLAQSLEVPHMAWNFHMRCPPNLLLEIDTDPKQPSDGCGLSATTGYAFPRTDFGNLLHDYLATPW